MWTQSNVKSQKKFAHLSTLFLHRTETLYSCYITHVLHSKGKIRVFHLQEVLFAPAVHSVGMGEYGHYTAQAQPSLLNSGATKKAFFILGR